MKSIYDEKYVEIITKLRAARIEKSITQNKLSKILNVPQSYISKVECCERRLDIVEFIYWLDALNLTINEFLPLNKEKESGNGEGAGIYPN
jgi:transcriptional regulator with XRE-family HTH domain